MSGCNTCGLPWNSEAFYPSMRTMCKECRKKQVKERSLRNRQVQAYERERAKRPERVAQAVRVTSEWREKHPEAARAQSRVAYAISQGRLVQGPCSICGSDQNIHAHHRDYSKPLEVVWLCARCHHRLHATFPELGGHHQRREAAE